MSRWIVAAWIALFAGNTALADVVEMIDGRRFEGEILHESPDQVVIDAMVVGIRARLTLKRPEILSVTRQPVSDDFFTDQPPSTADASAPAVEGTPYLEVPITGKIGESVFADGVAKSLAYANRYRIQHIVFIIDCAEGDLDEARRIGKLLMAPHQDVTIHALIRRCIGDAIVFPLTADKIQLLPNAQVGGSDTPLQSSDADGADQTDQVLREQVAVNVGNYLRSRGHSGLIAMAMIDPAAQVAVWKDEQGQVQTAPSPPEDLPADRIILQDGPDHILVINEAQTRAMGMPAFDGNAATYGRQVLGIADWKSAGDFGATFMKQTADLANQRAANDARRAEAAVAANIERRQEAKANLGHNIEQAKQWDPSKGNYATMGSDSSYDWRSDTGYSYDSPYLTKESRNTWTDRSDTTANYLAAAIRAANSLKRLDDQAVKLGLEPTFPPGELDRTIDALNTHWKSVQEHREKKMN